MPFPPQQSPLWRVSKIGCLQRKVASLAFARGGFYSIQFLRDRIGRIFGGVGSWNGNTDSKNAQKWLQVGKRLTSEFGEAFLAHSLS